MQSFEFKPALLRGRNNWTLDSGMLTRNGELFCSLSDIDKARFGEMTSSRAYAAWLDLHQGPKRRRIACNIRRGDKHNGEFMALNTAIFDALAEVSPDLPVTIGAGSGVKWAMFLIGALAAVFGAVMMGSAIMGGVNDGKIMFALLFGAGAVLFGGWLGWTYRPWATPATLTPSGASAYLAGQTVDE